jgi:hypothetical protein
MSFTLSLTHCTPTYIPDVCGLVSAAAARDDGHLLIDSLGEELPQVGPVGPHHHVRVLLECRCERVSV